MQIVSLINVPCGSYLDYSYALDLASTPFTGICREFENWRNLRALSGKFLRKKSCYPESFCFLWLCTSSCSIDPVCSSPRLLIWVFSQTGKKILQIRSSLNKWIPPLYQKVPFPSAWDKFSTFSSNPKFPSPSFDVFDDYKKLLTVKYCSNTIALLAVQDSSIGDIVSH